MGMGELHENGRIACAYGGVNGVTFCVIPQYSASGTSSRVGSRPNRPGFRPISSLAVNLRPDL